MTWPQTPMNDFMDWLARPTPRWAGGAAAAIVAAEGWALVAMTFGIVHKKHPLLGLEDFIAQAILSRDQSLSLAAADVAATTALSHDRRDEAMAEATRIPLAILKLAQAGKHALKHPARSKLPQAEPDFGTAEALFTACETSTRLIITANLPAIKGPVRDVLAHELDRLTEC